MDAGVARGKVTAGPLAYGPRHASRGLRHQVHGFADETVGSDAGPFLRDDWRAEAGPDAARTYC